MSLIQDSFVKTLNYPSLQVHDHRLGQLVQDAGDAARGPQEADGDAPEGHPQHEAAENDALRLHHGFQTQSLGPFR